MAKGRSNRKHKQSQSTDGWASRLSPGVKDLLCIGLLYVVILVLFRGLVFQANAFSTSPDTVNHYSYKKAGNTLMETEGVDAIWTPYVFSGMPTFGNVSYLPHNVSYLETIGITIIGALFLFSPMSWFVAFYFLGGVFMFFLMRAWKFSRPAALLAALTFMLSPYAIGLGTVGHGSKLKALSYLPLMMLLTHRLFERRSVLTFGLLAAGVGTLMLTNHVQIVYYVLLVMGLYFLYRFIRDIRVERRAAVTNALLFGGAIVLGLCISAYVYLSVREYAQFSIRGGGTEGSTGGLTWEYATNWSMAPVELLTLAIPSFFGFQSPYYWGSMPFTSSTVYAGIIPLLLAGFSLIRRRQGLTIFFLALTALTVLLSFGKHFALLYDLFFNYLPFFNKFRAPSTILHLLPFALGVLGAIGYTALAEFPDESPQRLRLSKALTTTLLVLVACLVIALLFKDSLFDLVPGSMLVRDGEPGQYQQQYGARASQIIDQFRHIRFYGNEQISGLWGDTIRFLLFSIASIGAVLLFLRRKLRQGPLATVLTVLLLADLAMMDARFINPVPAGSLDEGFRPDRVVSYLKEQPGLFRVFPLGSEQFGDNTYAYHGIQSLGGYNAAKLKIYQTLIDSCFYVPTNPGIPVNMNVVNMLNTRYIVTPYPLPESRFVRELADEAGRMVVYRNPSALPRAFFVRRTVRADSDGEVFRLLNSPGFDPSTTAIVQGGGQMPEGSDSANVRVTGYQSRRITLSTDGSGPALLVLSEVYYPAGWKAFVDGNETAIFRTNSILRSIVVPGGKHEILFTFEPSTYETGKTVTYAAWGITLLCIGAGLWLDPLVRRRLSGGRKPEPHA